MRRLAIMALVGAFSLISAASAGGTVGAPRYPVWEYPFPCYAYQVNQRAYLNGAEYVCEWVGAPLSWTGYAYVPQN